MGTVTRFLEVVIATPGLQRWLSEEGEHAMRLLTRHDTAFQPRAHRGGPRAAARGGRRRPARARLEVDLQEVAYVIVRLIESYTYLDLITGERPEAGARSRSCGCCCADAARAQGAAVAWAGSAAPSAADAEARSRFGAWATRTGTGLWCRTAWETLPSTRRAVGRGRASR